MAAVATLPVSAAARRRRRVRPHHLVPPQSAPLDYAKFRKLLGTTFHFTNHDTADAALVRLQRVQPISIDPDCEQFRLKFRVRRGLRLPEGCYRATNWRGHAEFDVYVQPREGDARPQVLFAYFADLKGDAAGASS